MDYTLLDYLARIYRLALITGGPVLESFQVDYEDDLHLIQAHLEQLGE